MHDCDIKMLQVRERRTILRIKPSRKIWEFGRFFETVRSRREVGRGQRLFLWKVQWKGNFDMACFTGKNELQVWRKNVGFFDSEIILISELFLIFKYIYVFAKLLSGRQREHFSLLESQALTCPLVYSTVPLMLNIKQWSCEYQFWSVFVLTWNRTRVYRFKSTYAFRSKTQSIPSYTGPNYRQFFSSELLPNGPASKPFPRFWPSSWRGLGTTGRRGGRWSSTTTSNSHTKSICSLIFTILRLQLLVRKIVSI